jgi:fructosamine-3-kinase
MPDQLTIKKILKNAGLKNAQVQPTGSGMYNQSCYLNHNNQKYVLRIAPHQSTPMLFYEKQMMRSEPKIHQRILNETNVPAPKIIYSDFSHNIIDRDYLIMQFLPGSPGTFDHQQLGRLVKQIHSITENFHGYPDRTAPTADNWPDIFKKYVNLIFDDCLSCKIIDSKLHKKFLKIYQTHHHAIKNKTPRLLHMDLWSQNILTQNNKITAILDYDRGLYGDPELEFAVLDTYRYSTPQFFKGYGQKRPDSKNAKIRNKLYIVYELIKYAFIRSARNNNPKLAKQFVNDCLNILSSIES